MQCGLMRVASLDLCQSCTGLSLSRQRANAKEAGHDPAAENQPTGAKMKRILLSGAAILAIPGMALAACPAVNVADMQGVASGAFPQQYDLAEFRKDKYSKEKLKGNNYFQFQLKSPKVKN